MTIYVRDDGFTDVEGILADAKVYEIDAPSISYVYLTAGEPAVRTEEEQQEYMLSILLKETTVQVYSALLPLTEEQREQVLQEVATKLQ